MSPNIRLSLTQAQRQLVAELLPDLGDRLKLDEKGTRSIPLSTKELEAVRKLAVATRPRRKLGRTHNSLRYVIDSVTKSTELTRDIRSIPNSDRLYQFKITLLDSQPPIWRRIQVKDCTLDEFHEHIQTAMGWTNSHLHQFDVDGEQYGNPDLLDDGFGDCNCVDSTVTKLSEIIPKTRRRFQFYYEYDFGDGWEHEILFEGCLRADKGRQYPLCLEGERNCPPEDVGGIWGYAEFLEAIANPEHEQHEDFVDWAGDFDPEAFDARKTTMAMREGLPDWRDVF
jgi:hypothetical protein